MPEPITTDTPSTPATEPPVVAAAAPAAAPPPDPPPPPAKTFTQEQLNAIVAEEKRKAREQGRNEARSQTPTPAAPAQPAAPPDALAEVQRLRDDIAFRDVIADSGLTLTSRQRDVLRSHYRADSPESVVELAREIFTGPSRPGSNGAPAAPAPPAAATPATPPAAAQPPSYVSPGAPQGTPDAGMDTAPMSWTKDQSAAYQADGSFMERIERWKATQPGGAAKTLFPSRVPKQR